MTNKYHSDQTLQEYQAQPHGPYEPHRTRFTQSSYVRNIDALCTMSFGDFKGSTLACHFECRTGQTCMGLLDPSALCMIFWCGLS